MSIDNSANNPILPAKSAKDSNWSKIKINPKQADNAAPRPIEFLIFGIKFLEYNITRVITDAAAIR